MRTYIVILSEINSVGNDRDFSNFIQKNNWEWWRYTELNWIIATPDSVPTNQILNAAIEAYGASFITVLEVTVNDVAGMFPINEIENSPANWFNEIKSPDHIPKWDRIGK